jgi:hypothetical protein
MTYTLLTDVNLFIIFVTLLAMPSISRINNVAGRLVSTHKKHRLNNIRRYLPVNAKFEGTSRNLAFKG